jgi:hypothetical protein
MTTLPALPDQTVAGGNIAVPNVREFDAAGTRLSVAYWHLYNHSIRRSGAVFHTKLDFWPYVKWRVTQFIALVTRAPTEQLFIRVSSNKPPQEALQTTPGKEVMALIARILSGETLATEK